MKKQYEERMKKGLCYCGSPVEAGRTLCRRCAENNALKAKMRYDNRTPEQIAKRAAYMKEYALNRKIMKSIQGGYQ